MPGRWNDERERDWQDWRSEADWNDRRREEDRERWQGSEDRTFSRGDRVFGERESGAEYNRGRGQDDWRSGSQERRPRRYRGFEGGYGSSPRFESQDYTRGGRYYGDDAQERIYREEYGLGGYDYGAAPRGYDEGRRYGPRRLDDRYEREMRRMASGGTGGYDYERGYGDAGRRDDRRERYGERRESYEDRARDAGDFLRRAGQRISDWFSDVSSDGRRDSDEREDQRRYEAFRGARGLGPKGYHRSDDRITDEVHQRLTDDPWLDASEISVAVASGEVTLTGAVDSREAKHRAERIVEDLSGVTHVQNNLRVREGNYFTSAGRGYGDSVQEARMASSDTTRSTTGDTSSTVNKRN